MSICKILILIMVSLVTTSSHWPGLTPRMRGHIGYTLSSNDALLRIDSVLFRRPGPMEGALSIELLATRKPDHQREPQILATYLLPPARQGSDTRQNPLVLQTPLRPPAPGIYHLHLRLFPTDTPNDTLDVVTFPHRRRFAHNEFDQ